MSCQTGIEASQELREFLGGCRGGCTRCVKVFIYMILFSFGDDGGVIEYAGEGALAVSRSRCKSRDVCQVLVIVILVKFW